MKDTGAAYQSVRQIRNILAFAAVILFLFVLKTASEVTLPIALALFIFAFINPLMERLGRLKVPNIISIVISLSLVAVIFFGFIYVLILMVNMLLDRLPYYAERVRSLDSLLSGYMIQFFPDAGSDFSILSYINVDWYGLATSWLASFSGKLISILSDAMLIFVILLFLLLERTTFLPKIAFAFPRDKSQKFASMLGRINRQISKYLLLKAIISLATGLLFYLTAVVTGLDFALVWGINVVYVVILTISIEMILGNIIDPRLQGVQLNMSPLMILISLSLWGYIWGLPGMFLAVPIMSIIQIVCALVPSLKPVAVLLSSGKSYIREYRNQESQKRRGRKGQEESAPSKGDIILPEGTNRRDG